MNTNQAETTAVEATANAANAANVTATPVDAFAEGIGGAAPAASVETIVTPEPAAPKAMPKYLVQRAKRQRFSFGNTWLNAVLAGVVTDYDKLVAHGVHVNAGSKEDLSKLTLEELLPKVQHAILSQGYVKPEEKVEEPTAEAPTEPTAEAPAAEAEVDAVVAAA